MLLGSGIVIETVEARVKSLERILKSYIEKRFTGYVTYRNDVQGVYISIAMVEGSIAGCKSIERGVVYEGIECCGVTMRYLYEPEGVIEVHDIQRGIIILDLVVSPLSRVERPSALTSVLGAKVGIPILALAPEVSAPATEVVAPPVRAPEVRLETAAEEVAPQTIAETEPVKPAQPPLPPPQPAPEATVAATAVAVAKPVEEKPIEIAISNECIDPVTLYMVMRSSQLLEVIAEPQSFQEIVNKIKSIAIEKKPSYVYVSSAVENTTIRIIYNTSNRSINIELEKDGSVVCGSEALKWLEGRKIADIKVWYLA